jgi:uncharacterized repeat protein (TIGR03803 family)
MVFTKLTLGFLLLFVAAAITTRPARAQTETVLHSFTYDDGSTPSAGLTSDGAGNFYGTTPYGAGGGTVFELSPNGSGGWNATVLHRFTGGADGNIPVGPVIFDSVGNLYGATSSGGAYNEGTVFELSPAGTSWTETILYSFAGKGAGAYPETGLIMDQAGNLYGGTFYTVFELSPSGGGWTERVIYGLGKSEFISDSLTMDANGNIFAAASSNIFELSPNGKGGWLRRVIHTFTGGPKDGAYAQGTPVFDQAGNLYGTTSGGGYGVGVGKGTVYELSPGKNGKWTEKILHRFHGGKDGDDPFSGVVLDASGNIYGTARGAGKSNDGTVFELVAPVGTGSYEPKPLWSFNGTDGDSPYGTLVLDNAGNLYGTTYRGGSLEGPCGGTLGCGVVFKITP